MYGYLGDVAELRFLQVVKMNVNKILQSAHLVLKQSIFEVSPQPVSSLPKERFHLSLIKNETTSICI